jgi:acetoacetyl-CoA reductase
MTGRVAVVTGGTRGIGGAISEALAAAGYRVAANYVGSTERAKEFQERTGIATFRFDVGDFEASREGVSSASSRSWARWKCW